MKPLQKSALREIRKNKGRYFAILAIIALGVGLFCGLRICRTAMVQTGDTYLSEYNLFDYRLISTLGFTGEDEAYFASLPGVNAAEGAVWGDFLSSDGEGSAYVLRAHSLTDAINRPALRCGRLPQADNEIIGDRLFFSEADLGREIRLSADNSQEDLDLFRFDSYTLVGVADSPYYLNFERGNTSIGSGKVSGFVYMPYGGFDVDYYSEIFVDIAAPGEIYSEEYNAALSAFEDELEAETEKRANLRYQTLVDDAQAELDDAQAEFDEEYANYLQEKADAEIELSDALAELTDAEQQIAEGEAEIVENEQKLSDAENEYYSGRSQYNSAKKEFETQKEAALAQLAAAQAEIDSNRAAAEAGIAQIEASGVLEQLAAIQDGMAQLQTGIDQIEAARSAQLGEAQAQLDGLLAQLAQLYSAKSSAETQRDEAIAALNAQISGLNSQIAAWEAELAALPSTARHTPKMRRPKAPADAPELPAETNPPADQPEPPAETAAPETEAPAETAPSQTQAPTETSPPASEAPAETPEATPTPETNRGDELRSLIAAAQGEIADCQQRIALAQAACEKALTEIEAQRGQVQAGIDQIQPQLDAANAIFDEQRAPLDAQLAELQAGLAQIEASGVSAQYAQLQAAIATLDAAQVELDAKSTAAMIELESYEEQLDDARDQLSDARDQIKDGWAQLEDGRAELDDARIELADGRSEYEDAYAEAQQQFADAEKEFADAQLEINDAQAEIDDIEPATLYALSRKTNVGYACFDNDSQIVNGVASVFPLFFLLVAALVCMTTMTRMVDEQRTEIGTLKALGYSKGAIMSKYLFYSGSAAALGTAIGYFGGNYLFPKVIWIAYGMMYGFAEIPYVLDPLMGVVSLAAALLCSMGATWASCNAELTNVPAELIRPKAPKAGKRILLERIGFIWRRLSFLKKVTMRNIFRYKKRFLMMLVGIGGCTALLVTGFGINDSVANLANDQFGRIMVYDLSVSFTDEPDAAMRASFENALFVYQGSADVAYGDQTKAVNLIISENPDLSGFIDLHAGEAPIPFPGSGACVISRSLQQRCGLNVGDTATIYSSGMERMDLRIDGIFDNYIDSFVVVGADSVASQWKEVPAVNSAFVNTDADVHAVAAEISGMEGVSNVSVTQDTRDRFSSMMSSLTYIVLLVVLCAAALAFVVLFNLTNINITERIREIATVKVLGFTLKETASYALSENLVLSAFGAIAGLPLGKALHAFVMSKIQVDMVLFDVRVLPVSMTISVVLTLAFAGLVNLFMLKKIDKINMAESLKTIE